MSFIYKITNQINNKSYIGKTDLTIEERWRTHKRNARIGTESCPILYAAIKKYGIENFKIEKLEECSISDAAEREIYWINYFDTFKGDGYNATMGGDGRKTLNKELIIKTYEELKTVRAVSRKLNHDEKAINKVLKEAGFDTTKGQRGQDLKPRKKREFKPRLNYQELYEKFLETKNISEVVRQTGRDEETIRNAVKAISGKTPSELKKEWKN